MEEVAVQESGVGKSIRNEILDFEDFLKKVPESFVGDTDNCPLVHSFADGIYVREIFIPKGTVVVGKIHKHSHPNFLIKGRVRVLTEYDGVQILEAPLSMISKAGTKRVVEALEDVVWVTIHDNPTDTQDLAELEKHIIAPSYEAYEKFKKGGRVKRIYLKFKKVIS